MIPLTVTATLRSPVHLGAKNTAAYFLAGLHHIPGRALLGAAAWAFLDEGNDPGAPEFVQRFISGHVSWGDLQPVPHDPATCALSEGMPLVAPRTAKECKLFGLHHGFADDLLAPQEGCAHELSGGLCGVGLARIDGVLVLATRGKALGPDLQRQHRTHLSIAFDTGTARSGYLYSREALQEGQRFRGEILCADDAVADAVTADLQRLPLAVGGARSRGYGQIDVAIERRGPTLLSAESLAACSREVVAKRGLPEGDAIYFTLTAASPWSLREPDGGHARTLTSTRLARALGVPEASARVLAGDARSEARTGWDGAAGLPIEVRHIIVAGSTYLCGVTGLAAAALQDRLSSLVDGGLGGHRLEGLGRVIVNHPVHFSTAEAHHGR